MDSQQILSLCIVAATAGLFLLNAFKKKRGGVSPTCGGNCACAGSARPPQGPPSSSSRAENA